MRELVVTNDSVLLSFVQCLLAQDGIEAHVFDRNISLLEGSIGAFPRRLVVEADMWNKARRLLLDAGLSNWLAADDRD